MSRTVASDKRAPMGKQSKRDLKIQILEQAITSFEDKNSPDGDLFRTEVKVAKKKDFSGFKV